MAEQNTQVPMTSQPRQAPLKPEEAKAPGEGTVTMVFPNPVHLTTNDGRMVKFNAGIQEVPESLADHEYLRLSGVKKHDKATSGWRSKLKPQPAKATAIMTQHHIDFMRSQGIEVADVHDAQRQFDALEPDEQQEFLKDAGDFGQESQYVLQRRVQDKDAGAKSPAPPNQKGGAGGPQPSNVNQLIDEGKVIGRGQPAGTGKEVVTSAQQTGTGTTAAGTGAPAGKPAAAASPASQAGQQTQKQTTASAKPPESKGSAKTEDKK